MRGCGMKTDDLITPCSPATNQRRIARRSATLLTLVAGGVLVSFLFVYFLLQLNRP